MVKGLHKVFKYVVDELNNSLHTLSETGSEVSYFIPEPRNLSKVTRLPTNVKKSWSKSTFKEIKHLINNKNFLIEYLEKGYTVTTCMDVYKSNIQYDGSLDKLKLRIVVIEDF